MDNNINSLVEKATTDKLYLYADDLKVFNEICSTEDAERLQSDIDRLYDWTQYSLLKFYPDKRVVMRIAPSRAGNSTLICAIVWIMYR